MQKRLTSVAISALTLAFSLILAEVFLRGFFAVVPFYAVEMWKYGNEHKDIVRDARAHVHRPSTQSIVMGKEVRIDTRGFRGANRPVDGRAHRILVLGDSIAFGFGVGEKETFAQLLEKSLPGSQVWNGGIGNYNTAQEAAAFLVQADAVNPSEALLAFFINDFEPTPRTELSWALRHSVIYLMASELTSAAMNSSQRNFTTYYREQFETGWEVWSQAANKLIASAKERGIPLRVLLVPELHSLRQGTFTDIYARVQNYFTDRGIAVCDGEQFFPAAADGREFWAARDDSHPNAKAHELLARALTECFYK